MPDDRTYVHVARVALEPGGDPAAVGAAVTVGLCGSWEHDGPCLFPHHSGSSEADGVTVVRTVFRAPAEHESAVRRLIDAALRTGALTGPDGTASTWAVLDSGPAEPTADENSLGDRIGGLPDSGA